MGRIGILQVGYFGAIFTPIAAYAVSIANQYLSSANRIELPETLVWAYFASLSLTLGHLLNEVFCPPLIATHKSLERYRQSLSAYVKNSEVIVRAARRHVASELQKKFANSSSAGADLSKVTDAIIAVLNRLNPDSAGISPERAFLRYSSIWMEKNSWACGLRGTILALYLIAAAFVLLIMATQFFRVVCVVFG